MNKVKKLIKNNIKIIFAFTIGIVLAGIIGVYAATVIAGSDIEYSNAASGLSATTVQDALDEAYNKSHLRNMGKFVSAYTYNESTCVTGEESTCVKTTCYKSTSAGSCPAGTIIKYKVNDTDIVTFHVMFDNGTTMTMQSQKTTLISTVWISTEDYMMPKADPCTNYQCNDNGPTTVLKALERATETWTNVNDQTYTMGTTTFKTNKYTGCSSSTTCTTNTYTLASRTAKARMITVQEAYSLGCSSKCPIWMYNYLYNSTANGGTTNDIISKDPTTGKYNTGYWTMNAVSTSKYAAWYIFYSGTINSSNVNNESAGARAVVVVSK